MPWALLSTAPSRRAVYERQYHIWGKQPPPIEVVRMGMPEGVLADGGVISGFLYFESPVE